MTATALKFDPSRHEYRLGHKKLEHITAIIRCLQSADFFTQEARDRGTAVHEAIKDGHYLRDKKVPGPYVGYLVAWDRFLREHDYVPLLVEVPLHHPTLLYAGTPDQYGLMDGKTPCVFEVKTGAKHPSYAIQTAAQAELIRMNGHKKPQMRFALCLQDDGNYKIDMHKEHTDYPTFLNCLSIYRWKRRHGLI